MDQVNGVSYPRTGKRGVPQQFPRRLFNMLESESQQTDEDKDTLIQWSDSGCAFNILDVSLFSTLVLPKYFRTNKFSSFQRNLNLYGFCKVRRGPDADMYAHPSFRRGHPEILSELKKCKSAADRKRQTQTPANTVQEILPAPSGLMGRTRAVSPSSSDEERTMRVGSRSNVPHNTRCHTYLDQARQRTHFSLNSSVAPATIPAMPHYISHHIQDRSLTMNPPSPQKPTGKLDLLALAITCLAEGNTTSEKC